MALTLGDFLDFLGPHEVSATLTLQLCLELGWECSPELIDDVITEAALGAADLHVARELGNRLAREDSERHPLRFGGPRSEGG